MTKSKVMRIVLIASSVLIILGVALMGYMLATEDERNVIELKLKDGATEAIQFESVRLLPGQECEYIISLDSERSEQYDLALDLVETEEGELGKFAYVKIMAGDEVLYDELLADAFEAEPIVFPVDFTKDKNTELNVIYYLPLDVGNEAQRAEAVFDLLITASNE